MVSFQKKKTKFTVSILPSSGAFAFCVNSAGNGSKAAAGGIPRVEYRRFIISSTFDLSLGRTRGGGGIGPVWAGPFSGMAG